MAGIGLGTPALGATQPADDTARPDPKASGHQTKAPAVEAAPIPPPSGPAEPARNESVRSVVAALRRFNADERRIVQQATLVPAELMAHWKKLETLHGMLERLEARGALRKLGAGERIGLRHELAQLLGTVVDVAEVRGEFVSERLREADQVRKGDLVDIAALVNRSLDFHIREVMGIPVAGIDDGQI
jgi:hypothetical protein